MDFIKQNPFQFGFQHQGSIPIEVGLSIVRTGNFDKATNSDPLRANLNLLKEIQDRAHLKMVTYRQGVTRYYDLHVMPKTFYPSDPDYGEPKSQDPRSVAS